MSAPVMTDTARNSDPAAWPMRVRPRWATPDASSWIRWYATTAPAPTWTVEEALLTRAPGRPAYVSMTVIRLPAAACTMVRGWTTVVPPAGTARCTTWRGESNRAPRGAATTAAPLPASR